MPRKSGACGPKLLSPPAMHQPDLMYRPGESCRCSRTRLLRRRSSRSSAALQGRTREQLRATTAQAVPGHPPALPEHLGTATRMGDPRLGRTGAPGHGQGWGRHRAGSEGQQLRCWCPQGHDEVLWFSVGRSC